MNTADLWTPIALLTGTGFVLAGIMLVRSLVKGRLPATSPEERSEIASLPMTGLQKRAWWGLGIGLAMVAACVLVIARAGPVTYFDDGDLRLIVLAFIMVTLATHLVVLVPTGLSRGGRPTLDERDRMVLARAPHVQAAAGLITVAAWSIALTESYRGEPGIPTGFMSLIFWSVFVAQIVAHSGGVLLGYWLARHHGEG